MGFSGHKELLIPDCWTIKQNNFTELEPDNKFDIGLVADYFVEDILQATFNDYIIDLGFYGNYNNNRNGFFKLFVIKGDFLQGELFEAFISRSTEDIKHKLDIYFEIIPKNQLDNIKGYIFGQLTTDINDFYLYSAIDNIQRNLTNEEINQFSKSSQK